MSLFPLQQNKRKLKKLQCGAWVGAQVGGQRGWSTALATGPAAPRQCVPWQRARGEKAKAGICGSTAQTVSLLRYRQSVVQGVRGRKQEGNTGQRGTRISVFISLSGCGLLLFSFFPSHIQSTRFLLPSGALNSSCECKAGLVRGRELRFAPADACKVTRSLTINYSVSHRKQQQERGSAVASGAGGRRGRYITS